MMVARGYLHISDGDFLALSVCSIYSLNLISIYGSSAKYVYYIMFFSLQNDDLKALFYAACMPSFLLYFSLLVGCHVIRLYFSIFLCQAFTISQ